MNEMKLSFLSRLENEAFARTSVVAFLMPLNLTQEALMEVKTMLAEAVVNAMIHGYENTIGTIKVAVAYDDTCIYMKIEDQGCGIEDIEQAMKPLYTSKEHLERSGMGMTIMQAFSDEFQVLSKPQGGTCVKITKRIQHEATKQ